MLGKYCQGHNVSVAIPPKLRTKLENTGLNLLIYHGTGDSDALKEIEEAVLGPLFHGQGHSIPKVLQIAKQITDDIVRDRQFLEKIQAHAPDLICLDPTPPARTLAIIPYKLDVPFIFLGQGPLQLQFSRSPVMPSSIPDKITGFTDEMTFSQRIMNTFIQLSPYIFDDLNNPKAVQDVAAEKPYISMIDFHAKALLWLIGAHNALEHDAPTMPNVKYVGHLISTEPKALSRKFKDFTDSAKHGLVVVSFGSVLKSVPRTILDKFVTGFERTKYKFVIRYSTLNSSNTDQFLFSDWLPQFDLLSHKNTRLFITHCGANGMHEAVLAGIPMIAFPAFAEQPHNAAMIVRKGFGLRLDFRTFHVDELVAAIEEVISNSHYKTQTKKASAIMRAARVPPVEEAAFWINHVLKFGADHLRSSGQDIPLWQYLGLDVFAVCLLVWHIVLFMFIKIILLFFHWYCARKEKLKRS